MKGKKLIIIVTAIVCVLAGTIAALVIGKKNKSESGDYITSGEWIAMLCEHTECEHIELPDGYKETDAADTRLINITAFKTIDSHKLARVSSGKKNFTDDDLYELAKQYKLIENEKKKYTAEDCVAILDRYNVIYFDEIWLDNYCEMEYSDNAKQINDVAVATHNDDYSKVTFSNATDASVGDVIVYNDENGIKRVGKVESVGAAGELSLTQPEIEEVLNYIDFSDIRELSFEDIAANNTAYEVASVYKPILAGTSGEFSRGAADAKNVLTYDGDELAGIKFTLSVEDNDNTNKKCLGIEMEDKGTGATVKYTSKVNLSDDAYGSMSVELSNIRASADMTYFTKNPDKYIEYRLKMNTEFSGAIGLEKEIDIPLFETTVPFEYGLVCLDFGVYIHISASGEASIKIGMPTNVCLRYDKENGLHKIKESNAEPTVETALSGEVELSLKASADLRLFWLWNLFGLETRFGAVAEGEEVHRDNGMTCKDVQICFPVFKAGGYIDGLFNKFEVEMDIYKGDPIYSYHYEYVPKVRKGVVPECSYGNDELYEQYNAEAKPGDTTNVYALDGDITVIYGHDLFSKFSANVVSTTNDGTYGDDPNGPVATTRYFDITDTGDGYEMVGSLTIKNGIPWDKYWGSIQTVEETYDYHVDDTDMGTYTAQTITYVGSSVSFTNLGRIFTITEYVVNDNGRGTCTLVDDEGNTLVIANDISLASSSNCYSLGDDVVIEDVHLFVPYGTDCEDVIHKICYEGGHNNDVEIEKYAIKLDESGNLSVIRSYFVMGPYTEN